MGSALYKERLEFHQKMQPLWRLDDSGWVKARKQLFRDVWRAYYQGRYKPSEKTLIAQYFIYGEFPPESAIGYLGTTSSGIVRGYSQLLSTPWTTEEHVRAILNSQSNCADQEQLIDAFPYFFSRLQGDINGSIDLQKMCARGLLGESYQPIYSEKLGERKCINGSPYKAAAGFLLKLNKYIDGSYGDGYFIVMDLTDFFWSCIKATTEVFDEPFESAEYFQESFNRRVSMLIEDFKKTDPQTLSDYQLQSYRFVEDFISSDDLPESIERHISEQMG